MPDHLGFDDIPTTILADVLRPVQVLASCIRPMWTSMPRIAGPAYTVRCAAGDNLMLHAAIYRAPPGCIVVVEGGDTNFALAGGNVCAVAKRRGISGFVLDGSIRDIGEIRAIWFPVFARGVIPVAGAKEVPGTLQMPVRCGGVLIKPGDIVVGDEDGIIAVPSAARDSTFRVARQKLASESTQSMEAWEEDHRMRVEKILSDREYHD